MHRYLVGVLVALLFVSGIASADTAVRPLASPEASTLRILRTGRTEIHIDEATLKGAKDVSLCIEGPGRPSDPCMHLPEVRARVVDLAANQSLTVWFKAQDEASWPSGSAAVRSVSKEGDTFAFTPADGTVVVRLIAR